MKRLLLSWVLPFLLCLTLHAQTERQMEVIATVHVDEPGNLSSTLLSKGYNLETITKLVISGSLNKKDFYHMNTSMGALRSVDISKTSATEIPEGAFKNNWRLEQFITNESLRVIGDYAFSDCSNLRTMTFPSSIDSIGYYAFNNCGMMEADLVGGKTLRFIGAGAFSSCYKLKSVDLTDTQMTAVSSQSFYYCQNLSTVKLPTNVSNISYNAFSSCSSLKEIDLSANLGLNYLGDHIFYNCSNLSKVILPASITSLSNPFEGCSKLAELELRGNTPPSISISFLTGLPVATCRIVVPTGAKKLYDATEYWNYFNNYAETGILLLATSEGKVFRNGTPVQSGEVIFNQGKSVTFEAQPNPGYYIRSVQLDDQELSGNNNRYTVPEGVTSGKLKVTFGIKSYDLALTIEGSGSLKYEERLITESTTLKLDSAAMALFVVKPTEGFMLDRILFNGRENTVQQDSLYRTPQLTANASLSVRFASLTEVGKLNKLNITTGPNGVTEYKNTPMMPETTISVKEGEAVRLRFLPEPTYMLDRVLLNGIDVASSLVNEELVLDALEGDALLECTFKTNPVVVLNLTAPDRLGELLTANQKEEITNLTLRGSVGMTDLYLLNQMRSLQVLDLKETAVTTISGGVFGYNKSLRKVVLPTVLTTIENSAFNACEALREVQFGAELESISNYAFEYCRKLNSLDLSGCTKLTTIASYAFRECDSLANVKFPAGLVSIESYAFQQSYALESIAFPASLQRIGEHAFYNCTRLRSVDFKACTALTEIASYAFNSCGVSKAELPASLNQVGNYLFSNLTTCRIDAKTPPKAESPLNESVVAVYVPGESVNLYRNAAGWKNYRIVSSSVRPAELTLTAPGTLAKLIAENGLELTEITTMKLKGELNAEDFRVMNKAMPSLIEVDLSESAITTIPANAFDGKSQLLSVKVPDGITSIGEKAFNGCSRITEFNFGEELESIGSYAFGGCSQLSVDLKLHASLEVIRSNAFQSCSSLKSIDLSLCENLRSIESHAFQSCSAVKRIKLPSSITSINYYTFNSCFALEKLDLSNCINLSSIDDSGFSSCTNLEEITLSPVRHLSLSMRAFSGCYKMKSITIKSKNIPSVSDYTFEGLDFNKCILYVPTGEAKAYGLASHWATFTTIRELGVRLEVGNNGGITYEGVAMSNGEVIFHGEAALQLVVKPQDGYVTDTLLLNGKPYNAQAGVVDIPAGVTAATVKATFALKKFNLNVSSNAGGVVKYNGSVLGGEQTLSMDSASIANFVIVPQAGYLTESIRFNEMPCVVQQDSLFRTPLLSGDSRFEVRFIAAADAGTQHKLSVVTGKNGRTEYSNTPLLSDSYVYVKADAPGSLTFVPVPGYLLDKVVLNDVDVTADVQELSYKLPALAGESVLKVSYKVNPVVEMELDLYSRLESKLTVDQKERATHLTLRGAITPDDISFMRDSMPMLSVLDMRAGTVGWLYAEEGGIRATSDIPSNAFYKDWPVSEGKKSLTEVYLPLNTVSIGNNAFRYCSNLRVVNLEECTKLSSIADNAFENTAIRSVSLKGVSSLGGYAFSSCRNLELLDLRGTTLKSISNLSNNSELKEVILPVTLESLENHTFSNCYQLTRINLGECTQLKRIGNSAFNSCYQLEEVSIPNSVTQLGEGAFYSCSKLQSIDLSRCSGLREIGNSAFYNCNTLFTVSLPVSVNQIGYSAFASCTALETIDLRGCANLTIIQGSTFHGCSQLKTLQLPESVTTIESEAYQSTGLKGTLQLPGSVTTIGTNAFNGCRINFCKTTQSKPATIGSNAFGSNLVAVFVPENSLKSYQEAEGWKYYNILAGEKKATVHVAEAGQLAVEIMSQTGSSPALITNLTVTGHLNETDFGVMRSNMTNLFMLDLSETSVEEIPVQAFKEKRILINFTAPKNLKKIASEAFYGCSGLDGEFILPDGVTEIGSDAFYNCNSISSIRFSENLKTIGRQAFSNCSTLDQELIFPDGLERIQEYAFSGCTELKGSVRFGSALTNLGSYAFSDCVRLKSADFTNSARLQTIASYTFNNCSKLEEIRFNQNLRTIEYSAFQSNGKLKSLRLPDSLQWIYESAFNNCDALRQLDFTNCVQLESIGGSAFASCDSLETVKFPESLRSLGTQSFANCYNLRVLNFGSQMSYIGERAFTECQKLAQISVSNPVPAQLGEYVFSGVKTQSCILSIPTESYNDYLTARQWGAFVQMRKMIDVEVSQGGSVSYVALEPETEAGETGRSSRVRTAFETGEANGALLHDRTTLYIDENEKLQFIISPDVADASMKVFYNEADVTDQVVNNVFTTPKIDADRGRFVVNFDIEAEITIGVSGTEGGTVSGAGTYVYGETVLLNAVPEIGYKFVKWSVAGVEVSKAADYRFDAIKSTQLLAHFEKYVALVGDANGDGVVNISDVVCVVDHIVGKNPISFIPEAADVNGDGQINISDVVGIVDRILNTTYTGTSYTGTSYKLAPEVESEFGANELGASLQLVPAENEFGASLQLVPNTKLTLSTTTPVFGFEFAYDGELTELDALNGFTVERYERAGRQMVLAYTLRNGIGAGETDLFALDGDKLPEDLLFVDAQGEVIPTTSRVINGLNGITADDVRMVVRNGWLRVECAADVNRIEIYTTGGNTALAVAGDEVEIASLSRAVYVVRVVTSQGEVRRKMTLGN